MTAVTFFRPVAAPRMDGALALLAFARPFLLLAALAFFAGFGGYLIFGPPQVMGPLQAHPAPAAAAAAPELATPASEESAPQLDTTRQA